MRPTTFLHTLWNSISSPRYYIDILNVKLQFSIRFLLISYLLLALLSGLFFQLFNAPQLHNQVNQSIQVVVNDFPADYSLLWNGLRLVSTSTASATTTYTLPMPSFRELNQAVPLLLQLNPNVKSVSDIAEHSKQASLFFIGDHELYLSQPTSGQWNVIPLSDFLPTTTFTFDKALITQLQPQLQQQVDRYLWLLPFILPIVFFFLTLPLRFIGVAIDTFLIFLIIKLTSIPLTLRKTIQLSLHIMVVAELVSLVAASFSSDLPMFSITFWGYTIIIYWQLRNVKALGIINETNYPEKDVK